jgi:hypothetical protein
MKTFSWYRKIPQKSRNSTFYTISLSIGRFYTGHHIWTLNLLDINGLQMTNFTPEDLLQYLYKESSPQQSAAIAEALQHDWTLREKLSVLKISMERLDSIQETPRTEVILNILTYAREKWAQEVG